MHRRDGNRHWGGAIGALVIVCIALYYGLISARSSYSSTAQQYTSSPAFESPAQGKEAGEPPSAPGVSSEVSKTAPPAQRASAADLSRARQCYKKLTELDSAFEDNEWDAYDDLRGGSSHGPPALDAANSHVKNASSAADGARGEVDSIDCPSEFAQFVDDARHMLEDDENAANQEARGIEQGDISEAQDTVKKFWPPKTWSIARFIASGASTAYRQMGGDPTDLVSGFDGATPQECDNGQCI